MLPGKDPRPLQGWVASRSFSGVREERRSGQGRERPVYNLLNACLNLSVCPTQKSLHPSQGASSLQLRAAGEPSDQIEPWGISLLAHWQICCRQDGAELGSHKRHRPLPRSWASLVEPWVATTLGHCLLAMSRDFMPKQGITPHPGRFGSANGQDRAQVFPCLWESRQVKTTGPPPPRPQFIAGVIDIFTADICLP